MSASDIGDQQSPPSKGPYVLVAEPARIAVRGSESRKRSEQVLVRLTPDEKADLAAVAAKHNLTIATLLRISTQLVIAQEAAHA